MPCQQSTPEHTVHCIVWDCHTRLHYHSFDLFQVTVETSAEDKLRKLLAYFQKCGIKHSVNVEGKNNKILYKNYFWVIHLEETLVTSTLLSNSLQEAM